MRYIERTIADKISKTSKEYPVILLTGPRQSGKTTLLKELSEKEGKNREYISLDDFNLRSMAKSDPAMFLRIHKPPVLIDEAQYAPELFTYIKIYVDEHNNAGDFWLTGSQVFPLMRGVSESLAGEESGIPVDVEKGVETFCVGSQVVVGQHHTLGDARGT